MKAIEQYLHVVLFIMLYKVVLTFDSIFSKPKCVTIQMKAIEQYYLLYRPRVLILRFVNVTIQMKATTLSSTSVLFTYIFVVTRAQRT